MTKQSTASPAFITPIVIAVVLAFGLLCLAGFSIWMAGSGWNMRGHMGRMMGGGRNTAGAPVVVGGTTEAVEIRDFAYGPGNLEVPVGATVRWTNYDDAPHTATAKNRDWDTGTLNKGESGSLTFRVAGDYTYYCTIHPSMVARVVVK
jgi:plastocyanin